MAFHLERGHEEETSSINRALSRHNLSHWEERSFGSRRRSVPSLIDAPQQGRPRAEVLIPFSRPRWDHTRTDCCPTLCFSSDKTPLAQGPLTLLKAHGKARRLGDDIHPISAISRGRGT